MRALGIQHRDAENTEKILINDFKLGHIDTDAGALGDEIEAEQDEQLALAFFNVAFHAAEWTGLDLHFFADTDVREGANFVIGFQRGQNRVELFLESLLVRNIEKVSHIITLINRFTLMREEAEEKVIGKERLLEREDFPGIFFYALEKRQRDFETFALAVLGDFFFAARSRMSDIPGEAGRLDFFCGGLGHLRGWKRRWTSWRRLPETWV